MATVTKVKKAGPSISSMWLVTVDGVRVGLVEKFHNSRTDTHPFKAFRYSSDGGARMIGVSYTKGTAGLNEAVNMILSGKVPDHAI